VNLLIQFSKKPFGEKVCLVEATVFLALMRAALLLVSFKRIAKVLGTHMDVSDEFSLIESDKLPAVVLASKSVKAMSHNLPWECKCLVQAAALKLMLKRRGVDSTLYLGVAKKDNFMAHAWLRVGDAVVIGGNGLDEYTVLSFFT
jgi:hypothetical protein